MYINKYKYAILHKTSFKKIYDEIPFYNIYIVNDLDIDLLGMCINRIRMECATFEEFKEKLLTDEYQALAFFVYDLYFDEIAYRPQTDTIAVCSGDTKEDIEYYQDLRPNLSKEDLADYEYTLPADNFFTVTKKIIDYFYQEKEWLLLYADESGYVDVEIFHPTKLEEYDLIHNTQELRKKMLEQKYKKDNGMSANK